MITYIEAIRQGLMEEEGVGGEVEAEQVAGSQGLQEGGDDVLVVAGRQDGEGAAGEDPLGLRLVLGRRREERLELGALPDRRQVGVLVPGEGAVLLRDHLAELRLKLIVIAVTPTVCVHAVAERSHVEEIHLRPFVERMIVALSAFDPCA